MTNKGKKNFPNKKKIARELLEKGYQFQISGDINHAIEYYRKSILALPTAEAHTFLGWAYSFQGHYDEAIRECQKAIKLDPEFGNPYNDIGAYLLDKGCLDEAIPWLEKAINAKRYDSYFYPHYNLGRIYEQKGIWSKAVTNYKRAIELKTDYLLARKAYNRILALLN